jgi:hypothetical protein
MGGIRIKEGDIFCVKLESNKKYFQYIISDKTMLNSYVIRAFKKSYPTNEFPDLGEIAKDEVDFYAHVFLRVGLKFGFWEKVGNVPDVGTAEVVFRSTGDWIDQKIKVSDKWRVWKANEPHVLIGKLEKKYKDSEIGVVLSPINIQHRMRTGKYKSSFPA